MTGCRRLPLPIAASFPVLSITDDHDTRCTGFPGSFDPPKTCISAGLCIEYAIGPLRAHSGQEMHRTVPITATQISDARAMAFGGRTWVRPSIPSLRLATEPILYDAIPHRRENYLEPISVFLCRSKGQLPVRQPTPPRSHADMTPEENIPHRPGW